MALYFLKGERDLPKNPPLEQEDRKPNSRARTILLTAGIVAILLAALIQASGLLHPRESRLPKLLGIPSPVQTRTVFLSLPIGADGGTDPMDVALVLRGLSMLHPSLILLASTHPISGDAAQLLQGLKDQLREKGIPLVEATSPPAESLWRPVPLCRYLPPGLSERTSSLPPVSGTAPAEGTLRYLPDATAKPGILPLLACTDSGEIIGSLWWEGVMKGQPNAPVWLLADRLLLLPNHAPLLFAMGGLRIPRDLPLPRSVTSDDFLLKMEEKERGSLSPDFDSLWEHAVVVVGPPSLLPMASALAAIRESTAWGALPLIWQGVILLILIGVVTCVFFQPQRPALLLVSALFIMGLSGAWWSLQHGLLPPILPWSVALLTASISLYRKI
jgi:hypothetical protein